MLRALYESPQRFAWDTYFVENCCTAAIFSVYMYDRLLTFSREVDAVWRAPKWGFCVLYSGMHVSAMLYFSSNIATWVGLDCQSDRILYPVYSASWCTLSTLLAVITATRAYGMNWYSERRWLVPGVILCLLFVGPTFAIVSVVYTLYQKAPEPVGCIISSTRFVFSMNCVRACCIAADSLVLFVTWKATYSNYRQGRLFKTPILLSQQLLEDGFLHYIVLLILNIVILASWVVSVIQCSMFVDMFTVILISRFVIGVREASRRGSGSWTTNPSRMSDVEFLSSKLQTFALEDVTPGLYDDSDENWHDDYDDKSEPSIQVSSVDEEAIASGSIDNPQVLAGENSLILASTET